MSELRWNPVLGEWTITATHRQERTFLPPTDECPLCPHPAESGLGELARDDFEVAVFENRFPSLQRRPPEPSVRGTSLTPVAPSEGACEVVVYTPQHTGSLADASLRHLRHLIAVWAHRTRVLGARPEVDYVYVFENRGEAIGVTLHHPHGQVYGYPFVPPIIERELDAGEEHRAQTAGCLWCALRTQEVSDGSRVVAQAGSWLAVVPFFARWPYEVHLLPARHMGWLTDLDAGEVADLARVLRAVLRTYDALFGFPLPYVMAVHQRPTDGGDHPAHHLHFEFYPPNRTSDKLKYLAGSEAGAGAFINDTLPEESAALLRNAARVAGIGDAAAPAEPAPAPKGTA
jgi:UDPglucose--hexose-1-phosphate uridylyltransferase